MKRIPTLLLALCLLIVGLSGCGGSTPPPSEALTSPSLSPSPSVPVTESAAPGVSATLVLVMPGDQPDVYMRDLPALSIEGLAGQLEEITGYPFPITASSYANDTLVIDWDSEELQGVWDSGAGDDLYACTDREALLYFQLDSLHETLMVNYGTDEIYYTMDGGQDFAMSTELLYDLDPSLPYRGSRYYREQSFSFPEEWASERVSKLSRLAVFEYSEDTPDNEIIGLMIRTFLLEMDEGGSESCYFDGTVFCVPAERVSEAALELFGREPVHTSMESAAYSPDEGLYRVESIGIFAYPYLAKIMDITWIGDYSCQVMFDRISVPEDADMGDPIWYTPYDTWPVVYQERISFEGEVYTADFVLSDGSWHLTELSWEMAVG